MYRVNGNVIEDILSFIVNEYVIYEPDCELSINSVDRMDLFNFDNAEYESRNGISCIYNGQNIIFSDINIYDYKIKVRHKIFNSENITYIKRIISRKKKSVFNGIYIGVPLNKKAGGHIYLIPNTFSDRVIKNKILGYTKYHGELVMLENLDISKRYKVFCNDEIQARCVLTLNFMEKINKLDEMFPQKKYVVFKADKRVSICIEGVSIEKIRKIILPIFRNRSKEIKTLTNIFTKLSDLVNIYNVLDLKNNLYLDI